MDRLSFKKHFVFFCMEIDKQLQKEFDPIVPKFKFMYTVRKSFRESYGKSSSHHPDDAMPFFWVPYKSP